MRSDCCIFLHTSRSRFAQSLSLGASMVEYSECCVDRTTSIVNGLWVILVPAVPDAFTICGRQECRLELQPEYRLLTLHKQVGQQLLESPCGTITVEPPVVRAISCVAPKRNLASEVLLQSLDRLRPSLRDIEQQLEVIPLVPFVGTPVHPDESLAVDEACGPRKFKRFWYSHVRSLGPRWHFSVRVYQKRFSFTSYLVTSP